jgi:uroporphyrinogen-III synthase
MTRALVTRPREEAEELAAALAKRGIEALVEPLLEIHWREVEGLDLGGVQALLCTSANGVRALARTTSERRLPLFAVGEATAARARAEGFAQVASAGGDAADLARLAAMRLRPQAGRLLHVAGSVVAGDLAGELSRHGFAVERLVLYEARPVAALSAAAAALRVGAIDLALFFSPRTAQLFARLAEAAGVAGRLAAVTAVSISKAADAALVEHRWQARVVAERPNQKALLEALDRVLAGHSGG